jgi:class 3 adenylate cyclase
MESGVVLPSLRGQRALAAIVVTDAVGFSARMSVNEELTLELIERDLHLMAELCAEFEGQVLKSTGDGLLMYFVSAVQAVACSMEIQKQLVDIINENPEAEFLEHRIGVHLGDVFFSQFDAMGNGVNIAARLQTQAEPGGICMSQIVYDVVRVPLSLEAVFIGPLHLKNIQEAVPAYQIPPLRHAASNAAPVIRQPSLKEPDPHLVPIIQTFAAHPDAIRLKKLLFGACYQAWENDPEVLAEFEFQDLLQILLRRRPTLESMRNTLQQIVALLNRQEQYAPLAKLIMAQVTALYSNPITLIQVLAGSMQLTNAAEPLYRQISDTLKSDSNYLRIKKLLYSLCYHTWENDPAILVHFPLSDLLRHVHQLAPYPHYLDYLLHNTIQKLNHQREYQKVIEVIAQQFQRIYELDMHIAGSIFNAAPIPEPVATAEPATQNSTPDSGEWEALEQDTSGDHEHTQPLASSSSTVEADPPPPSHQTEVMPSAGHPSAHYPASANSVNSTQTGIAPNWPELCEELTQTADPLRLKTLLFACLYGPPDATPEGQAILESLPLEELLNATFDYCPTLADLENKLTVMAHCLSEPDLNLRVASTMLQTIAPYYSA